MAEVGLEVGAAAFVALQRALEDRLGQREHVEQRLGEDHVLVGPVAGVGQRALRGPLLQLARPCRSASSSWSLWRTTVAALVMTSPSSWWIRYGFSPPPVRLSSSIVLTLDARLRAVLEQARRLLGRRPSCCS